MFLRTLDLHGFLEGEKGGRKRIRSIRFDKHNLLANSIWKIFINVTYCLFNKPCTNTRFFVLFLTITQYMSLVTKSFQLQPLTFFGTHFDM